MKFRGVIIGLALATLATLSVAQTKQVTLPPEIQAVQKYVLENDYPEVIGGNHYRTRVNGVVMADVDNDGNKDVVISYFPHYRQSASIVFYRLDRNLQVTRVSEGFAPGPVQKISGEYLDSHEVGHGVDATVGDGRHPIDAEKIVQITRSNFGGLVAYKTFFHADGRSGPFSYVDMTHVDLPVGTKTCASFEFSRVRQIAVGPLQGTTKNYLAAWVGDEIYIYLIKEFRPDGLMDKQLWIRKAPAGFEGFIDGQGLAWKTRTGAVEVLALP